MKTLGAPSGGWRRPPANPATPASERYATLDAMRGVAALAVVLYHLRAFRLAPDFAPHAYLAVDFFFVLSGFVVAHAYSQALLGRMSFSMFARRRVVRLAPLAVLGAATGLALLVLKQVFYPAREDPLGNILISGLLNLFLLPSFITGSAYQHDMFPGDGPLWSLFFEMSVNLAWGWMGVRLTTRQLTGFVFASAVFLLMVSIAHGSTRMGVEPATFVGGAARAFFGFSLGVLIWRLRTKLVPRSWPLGPLAAALALVIAFCAPRWLVHGPVQALIWDLAWILAILPMIVVFAAGQAGTGHLSRFLGEISYPIYVLHWPCLAVLSGMRQTKLAGMEPSSFLVLSLAAVLSLSWLALKLYDEPLRRFLGVLARKPRPQTVIEPIAGASAAGVE